MIEGSDEVLVEGEAIFVMVKMGQERCYIIGQVIQETENDVVLHHPMAIDMTYHGDEGMRIIINDYMPFARDKLVSITKNNIHAMTVPKDSIIDYYLEYKRQSVEQQMEQILEARIRGLPDPEDTVLESFNDDPPTEQDTKH